MQIFSFRFLGILILAMVVMRIVVKRKKKGPTVIYAKQIPVRGDKLSTPISKSTPLVCLLAEGKVYGEDFKDKEAPTLPHGEGCQCTLDIFVKRSHDWLNETEEEEGNYKTDIGMLSKDEFRYYKYMLIAHHPDADEQTHQDYLDLIADFKIAQEFKAKVNNHLSLA